MSRYDQLVSIVDLIKPRTILEIGTWSGRSAVTMLHRALQYRKSVKYEGYDLFDAATDQTDTEELNLKEHYTVEQVEKNILSQCPGASIRLVKGNTRETLDIVSADLCFIDGGHSIETILNDYAKCQYSSVIILDDYYTPDEDGLCPDIELYGCNKLIEGYDMPPAVILPIKDKVKTGGYTQMVMVLGCQQ